MNLHATFCFVAAVAALALGVFALILDRRSPIWHVFLAGMLLLALNSFFAGMGAMSLLAQDVMSWERARLVASSLLPVTWVLFSLTYARCNRMESIRRWSPLLAMLAVVPIAAATGWQQDLVTQCVSTGPEQTGWITRLGLSGKVLQVLLLLTSVWVLMNLERTFRGAVGTMRWRVKFMILGVGTVFAVRIHTSTQALLYSDIYPDSDVLNAAALLLGALLMVRGLLRARADRVDLYISHTVLYRSATVLLSGLYLFFVGILARFFQRLGGTTSFPLLALVIFTGVLGLGVLLASDRLRLYTKRFISLHFRRPQYDYRQVWMRFAEATAGLMNREAYCRSVVRMTSETFEALSVTIWLTGPSHDRLLFGASTSLTDGKSFLPPPDSEDSAHAWNTEALRALCEARRPIDIEDATEAWAATLRDSTPASFPGKGGRRIAMPLVGQNTLTGIMVIGDRVVGVPFTPEELDLLGAICGQIGAGLLTMDLSERLLQSREMEAFQTMSAFFVHDLKNTASTLSLMLENLPKHFADPAFREDALKAIARSVGRIENLIRRLTALRHKLDVHPVKTDLNELVRHTFAGLADTVRPEPIIELGSLPPMKLDPEQMEKVLTNLLLNAADATERQGEIRVRTQRDGNAAVLTVSDKGCGMSHRFIEESLFRPFKSTKKDGMGIGLFQSRMIVEAHGGKIVVESEEGSGSTFRVRLPLDQESQ